MSEVAGVMATVSGAPARSLVGRRHWKKRLLSWGRAFAATIACLLCAGAISCASATVPQRQAFVEEVLHYSRGYARQCDYRSLRWLADHALFRGMSRESVKFLLGEGGEPPEGCEARGAIAYGAGYHTLLVHCGDYVDGWEWVSSE